MKIVRLSIKSTGKLTIISFEEMKKLLSVVRLLETASVV